MMTLPDLSHISNIDELRAENTRLASQARKMLAATDVLDILGANTNTPRIGGSYKYGLMVYPDIDCDIVDQTVDKQKIAQIAATLIATDFVRKISVVNTTTTPSSKRRSGIPKGFWIGLEIPFEGDRWGIDCWIQKPEWILESQNSYDEKLREISQEQIDAILLIKHWLIINNLYGNKYYSADVYDAILDNAVLTIDDFKNIQSLQ